MPQVSPKKLMKQAKKAAKSGQFAQAAELFEQAGEVDEAVRNYLAARTPERAASLLAKRERFGDAAGIYERLGRLDRAAELFERGRDFGRAAAAYGRAGKAYRQARAMTRAQQWDNARVTYERMGLYRRAAEAAESGGSPGAAAELYRRAWHAELERHGQDPAAAQAWATRRLAKKAGLLFAKAGKVDEGVGVLEKAELFDEIADVFRQAGDPQRAADYLARSGRFQEAARTLEDSGDLAGAERMRGEVCLQKGQVLEAVTHFEKAGDLVRAAELYEQLNDTSNAGRLFEAAGAFERAAGVFERTGDPERGAAAYEKAENWLEAARLYNEAGNVQKATEMLERAGLQYEVGVSYFERGLFDQAIRALQAISPESEDFVRGKRLLGDIFREKGMLSLAIKNYQLSVGERPVSPENIETYYQMALAQEKDNSPEAALATYEKILVADYHYKDVGTRVQSVRRQIQSRRQASQRTSGGFTPSGGAGRVGAYDETMYGAAPSQAEQQSRRYEVLDELGRGGMGIVYKARDQMLDRTVALKVLPPAVRAYPQALENFMREAKSAAALNHPNIVTVYDVGEEAGETYISMEYVEGRTIKELLVSDERLPHKAALVIAGQVCKALQYAHENRVIHRDIKPSNIMWTEKKQVKLMDFGLAKILNEVTNQSTRVAGTPFYMSPEQTKGEGIDYRTDLYSLGVTLFEMLTGTLPFPEGDIAYHHVHTPAPSMREKVPELPASFDDVVLTLLQKNKEDRYQSAQEVFDALKRVASE